MKNARPALRYAKAILNLAIDKGIDAEINNNMLLISETIEGSDDLKEMLKSPVVKATEKINVLNVLFGDKVHSITKNVFTILKDNNRLIMLEAVAKQYSIVYDYHKDIKVAKVTTAVALTKELEDKIQKKIVELTGNNASIENKVNPDILGGFILRIGDLQYDASVSNQFRELRKQFDNSQYIPKI